MEELEGDPWKKWKNAVYTWMLCCKHSKYIKYFINQDIAKKIAKLVKVDLKNSEITLYGNKYRLNVVAAGLFLWSGSQGRQWSACYMCLRPMKLSHKNFKYCKCCIIRSRGVLGVPINQIETKLLNKIYDLPNYEWARDGYENTYFIKNGEERWLKENDIDVLYKK